MDPRPTTSRPLRSLWPKNRLLPYICRLTSPTTTTFPVWCETNHRNNISPHGNDHFISHKLKTGTYSLRSHTASMHPLVLYLVVGIASSQPFTDFAKLIYNCQLVAWAMVHREGDYHRSLMMNSAQPDTLAGPSNSFQLRTPSRVSRVLQHKNISNLLEHYLFIL